MYLCVRAHVECICFSDGGNSGPPPGVENNGGRQVPQTAQRYLETGTRNNQASLIILHAVIPFLFWSNYFAVFLPLPLFLSLSCLQYVDAFLSYFSVFYAIAGMCVSLCVCAVSYTHLTLPTNRLV